VEIGKGNHDHWPEKKELGRTIPSSEGGEGGELRKEICTLSVEDSQTITDRTMGRFGRIKKGKGKALERKGRP